MIGGRYRRSEAMLARALKTVPLGTQTFSKSRTQYPEGVSPFYLQHGEGCRVWDLDGNEYVDFVNGLCCIILGYRDPDVTAAVRAQLDEGVLFSLPHPIEVAVAEKVVELVPSAEMVRFAKNGSDATAGAVRLARAHTGRDHIAVCGYHGWQDWYIGSTTRSLGVPVATRELTHPFAYNDLESLHTLFREWPDGIAAVILEPMNVVEPQAGFLEGVREIAHENGALLLFDEIVTGFRFANGGAQEMFSVTPDLTTLGKGIANGYPLSAVCGRGDVMRLMDEVFFSFTMGGETLSLAAGLATMTKVQRQPVVATLREIGGTLLDGVRRRISDHGVGHFLAISGHPSWTFLGFRDANGCSQWELKTLYIQEILARGALGFGSHNMSYAHGADDVARLLAIYDEVFPILRDAVDNEAMQQYLRCKPIEPLFQIR